jgi:diadenosine tetraphosphate (Ap4A) HIT family hydrolase
MKYNVQINMNVGRFWEVTIASLQFHVIPSLKNKSIFFIII